LVPIDVLIVEDDPMVLALNQRFTQRLGGFRVTATAQTGAEALRLATSSPPHLVLLDVYLPDMSGLAVLREIRRAGLNTDVIVITAAHDAHTVQEALRSGACDYLMKPFTFDRFRQAMTSYLLRHARLSAGSDVTQDIIDGLLHSGNSASSDDLPPPKGVDPVTLAAFLRELEKAPRPLSASDLARRLGVSRITAVRYLRYLQDRGQVIIRPVYGNVGRPVKTYTLKPVP